MRDHRFADTGAAGWSDRNELAILPLAGPPQVAKLVVLKLCLAEHGLEGAGRNFRRDSLAVETFALDRLLQNFQRGVGDDACPVVRRLAGHGLMALAVVCNLLA